MTNQIVNCDQIVNLINQYQSSLEKFSEVVDVLNKFGLEPNQAFYLKRSFEDLSGFSQGTMSVTLQFRGKQPYFVEAYQRQFNPEASSNPSHIAHFLERTFTDENIKAYLAPEQNTVVKSSSSTEIKEEIQEEVKAVPLETSQGIRQEKLKTARAALQTFATQLQKNEDYKEAAETIAAVIQKIDVVLPSQQVLQVQELSDDSTKKTSKRKALEAAADVENYNKELANARTDDMKKDVKAIDEQRKEIVKENNNQNIA